MFHGTIDAAEVHPREVVKQALRLNAAAVIVSHNHPSGNPEPSAADKALTSQLRQALALVDVRRSEERRVGKECVSTCSSRWSPYDKKKKRETIQKHKSLQLDI